MAKPTGSVGHFFGGVVCIEHTNNDNTRPVSYLVVTGPPVRGSLQSHRFLLARPSTVF
jgi:hypothetical protein